MTTETAAISTGQELFDEAYIARANLLTTATQLTEKAILNRTPGKEITDITVLPVYKGAQQKFCEAEAALGRYSIRGI